ncbi:MAG: hypothetical protein A2Y66_02155 [Nitrospirae bacterium RBG_13_41_22]|nr:MAG: hypothetical protein A2Y66_02155 [Nitrospirae bacterium RBG_13_41_22]
MAENMETERHLKTVVKGAGLVFFGLAVSKVLTYFYRLILARYYGPQDYGLISIGLSVITVIVTVLVLGMDSGILRYVPQYKAKNDEKRVKGIILTPFKISILFSIAAAILLWFFSPVLAGIFAKDAATQASLITIFQIFSFTLPFSVCYNLFLAASRGFQRMDYPVYTDNIFYSIVLVTSVALFSLFGLGIEGIALSYALTVIASFLLIFYFFNRRIFNLFSKIKPVSETQTMLGYAFPLFIGSIASIVISSFDTIFLGFFKTVTDVGIYNAALPTARFMLIFSSAFIALFAPIIIEYRTKKMKKEILTLYRTTTKWIFVSGFPFLLLIIFFSRNVLSIMFGPEYASAQASSSLTILGIAFFIQSLAMTSNLMLLSSDKTKYAMVDIILAVLANTILNVILIPQYGIFGAALATSISLIFAVLMDSIFAWKFTKMNPFDLKTIFKSLLAGIVSLMLTILIYRYAGIASSPFTLLPLFFLFLLIYLSLLLIFRTLDKNDIFILTEIEKKSGIKIGFLRKIFKRFAL